MSGMHRPRLGERLSWRAMLSLLRRQSPTNVTCDISKEFCTVYGGDENGTIIFGAGGWHFNSKLQPGSLFASQTSG